MEEEVTKVAWAEFELELGIFNEEVHTLGASLGAFMAINEEHNSREAVRSAMGGTPWFWQATVTALRAAIFITLGRIFDNHANQPHSIAKLLSLAKRDIAMFGPAAILERRRARFAALSADERAGFNLDSSEGLYEPDISDFRMLDRQVKEQRRIFKAKHQDIRHKWFAHREYTKEDVGVLFEAADLASIEGVAAFLSSLNAELWNAYQNGHRPVIDLQRFQADSQMIVTKDTKAFLKRIAP
ncbi:hypothetical protein [Xanthomonas sp. NCPPB 2632]|uniref:AbiU2 domain-containing protein n=1 Tax=Xanthomonas sp. NCPPB 2632 TaxID=3240912 RepID=UPI0035196B90